ncbi:MAG: DUF3761 domain-containing protein [Gemmatimonadaceae bacterium]
MTIMPRFVHLALLTAALVASAEATAQSAPPPPRRDSAPALLPPPPVARPEAVTPRTRPAAIVAPSVDETARRAPVEPLPASAAVESVRPALTSTQQPQSVREAPRVDPPPPTPVNRASVQRAAEAPPAPDGPPPAGATARCKDGTYLFTPTTQESCSDRGGLAVILASRPVPPTPPRRP